MFDVEHEKESFEVTKFVVSNTLGVTNYPPESKYWRPALFTKLDFPLHSSEIPHSSLRLTLAIENKIELDSELDRIKKISIQHYDSLNELFKMEKENGLTHLVLDGKKDRPNYLNDIYYNEKNYPFLKKIYDSADLGFKYHVKIFEIDYSQFLKNNEE